MSQNFVHENLATIFVSYANNNPEQLSKILMNIDFSGKEKIDKDMFEKFKELYVSIKTDAKVI